MRLDLFRASHPYVDLRLNEQACQAGTQSHRTCGRIPLKPMQLSKHTCNDELGCETT